MPVQQLARKKIRTQVKLRNKKSNFYHFISDPAEPSFAITSYSKLFPFYAFLNPKCNGSSQATGFQKLSTFFCTLSFC